MQERERESREFVGYQNVADGAVQNMSPDQEEMPYLTRFFLGFSYMMAMGVCGTVLVSLGITLPGLAKNTGTVSSAIGSVFIARGIGAILGPVISSQVYSCFQGWAVIFVTLFFLSTVLLVMPFISEIWVLHIAFSLMGICTAVTDTGVQILTRKAFGSKAGPWLGANTVFFGVSGAIVPWIVYFFPDLRVQYLIVALFCLGVAFCIAVSPRLDRFKLPEPAKCIISGRTRTYKVEVLCSTIVFCLIGGQVSVTAYLMPYAVSTFPSMTANTVSILMVVLWVSITLGRLGGLHAQCWMTLDSLYAHFYSVLFVGLASIVTLSVSTVPNFLWVGVALYGLANGPTLGFLYDLANRETIQSEVGMSIIMFGLNLGASLLPYITSFLWQCLPFRHHSLVVVLFFSTFLPFIMLSRIRHIARNDLSIANSPFRVSDGKKLSISTTLVRQSSFWLGHDDHHDHYNTSTDISEFEGEEMYA